MTLDVSLAQPTVSRTEIKTADLAFRRIFTGESRYSFSEGRTITLSNDVQPGQNLTFGKLVFSEQSVPFGLTHYFRGGSDSCSNGGEHCSVAGKFIPNNLF